MQIEIPKALVGKRGRRAQLAGAERRQWPARALNVFRDLRETIGQRHRPVEAHALDLESGIGCDSTRILEHGRNEPVIAGGKVARHVCSLFSCYSSCMRTPLAPLSSRLR